jgi:hypothetical protein
MREPKPLIISPSDGVDCPCGEHLPADVYGPGSDGTYGITLPVPPWRLKGDRWYKDKKARGGPGQHVLGGSVQLRHGIECPRCGTVRRQSPAS